MNGFEIDKAILFFFFQKLLNFGKSELTALPAKRHIANIAEVPS